jgi:hypothetical protein
MLLRPTVHYRLQLLFQDPLYQPDYYLDLAGFRELTSKRMKKFVVRLKTVLEECVYNREAVVPLPVSHPGTSKVHSIDCNICSAPFRASN